MKFSRISLAYDLLAWAAAFACGYAGYQLMSTASYYSLVQHQVDQWCRKSSPGCRYAYDSGDLANPEITLVYHGRVRPDTADRARKELESRNLLLVSGHRAEQSARPIGLRAEGQ